MRAIQVTEPGTVRLVDVPKPSPAANQVLVRTDLVGICGTDTKILGGDIPVSYPRVLGHEMVGEIVQAPADSPYPAGTRVLVDPGISCGWCELCRSGRPNICRNGGLMGRDEDGVFTEYVVVPFSRLVPVPPTVSARASGVLQVLGTCVHATKAAPTYPGRVAAVVGLGVAGQLIGQLLALSGMTVVGVTRSEWKRALASECGIAAVASPNEAAGVLGDLTGGKGPDLVVEAVGTEATLAQVIDMAAIGGEVLVFGTLTGAGSGLPYYDLYRKELTIRNPRAAVTGDYAEGVTLAAAGALRLEPLVTHEVTLDDAAAAFALVEDPSSLKVTMTVT